MHWQKATGCETLSTEMPNRQKLSLSNVNNQNSQGLCKTQDPTIPGLNWLGIGRRLCAQWLVASRTDLSEGRRDPAGKKGPELVAVQNDVKFRVVFF
jgi:hypothetical protein